MLVRKDTGYSGQTKGTYIPGSGSSPRTNQEVAIKVYKATVSSRRIDPFISGQFGKDVVTWPCFG